MATLTKVQAIAKLIKENGGQASWPEIYGGIARHLPSAVLARDWKAGLRGVVYREIRNKKTFEMAGSGVVALRDQVCSAIDCYTGVNLSSARYLNGWPLCDRHAAQVDGVAI